MVESSSPVVVLANLLEVVNYGKGEIMLAFLTDFSDKIKHFETLVTERDRTKRLVICCKDMKTTNMVGLTVSELGEKETVLHSGTSPLTAINILPINAKRKKRS